MSGWIKWEKDLNNDPRVLRMASRLSNGDVTLLSRSKLTIIGGLIIFWSFADTHIRDDDTIECAVEEINEVVGITNFCDLLPADWFKILNPNRVHLIDFLKHNGIDAKKKALAAKRQERHRRKYNASVTPKSRESNAPSVISALPDLDLLREESKSTDPAAQAVIEIDPRQALWTLGVSVLGANARSLIGGAIKRVGEPKVGEVLGSMALRPPAEPRSYFVAATQGRGVVV
jgi:hypothetical protein